jgi:hypothetical protein
VPRTAATRTGKNEFVSSGDTVLFTKVNEIAFVLPPAEGITCSWALKSMVSDCMMQVGLYTASEHFQAIPITSASNWLLRSIRTAYAETNSEEIPCPFGLSFTTCERRVYILFSLLIKTIQLGL